MTTNSPAYGTLQDAMLVSLERMAIGFAVGGTIAVLLALVAGLSRFGENAVDPLLQIVRMLPLFGLIPVFIVWFGIGELPKIILIALGAAIPLYLNTFAGIRSVDAKLAEVGQVLRLTRGETIRHVVLPGALPQALTGLRQSLGVAWLALVVAEQVNANAGLGFMISQATQFLRNDVILVALAVYAVLGLITDALVRLLERRALAWRRGLLDSGLPAPWPAGGPAARVRGLTRAFDGRPVLDGVDLDIAPGEFVAMLGVSGTGKSTLLRALAGLDREVTGELSVPGPVAVAFQEPRLLPWRRVLANVSLGLRAEDPAPSARRALEEVGLTGGPAPGR